MTLLEKKVPTLEPSTPSKLLEKQGSSCFSQPVLSREGFLVGNSKICVNTVTQKTFPYVTLAKPVGSAREHMEWVAKKDVDELKRLEDTYNIFTHMTPSYGFPGRCITVKGINTVNHDGEIVPCPYMDLSIGNVTQEPLEAILARGMKTNGLGPTEMSVLLGKTLISSNFTTQRFPNIWKNSLICQTV